MLDSWIIEVISMCGGVAWLGILIWIARTPEENMEKWIRKLL